MSDFKDRLRQEYHDLSDKRIKLGSFLEKEGFEKLSKEHQSLLMIQHQAMLQYEMILYRRLELLKLERSTESNLIT